MRATPGGKLGKVGGIFDNLIDIDLIAHRLDIPSEPEMGLCLLEAAIGESLDRSGQSFVAKALESAAAIECDNDLIVRWTDRVPATDREVADYFKRRLYRARQYNHRQTMFSTADMIRLHISAQTLSRVGDLWHDKWWQMAGTPPGLVVLSPSRETLREQQDLLDPAQASGSGTGPRVSALANGSSMTPKSKNRVFVVHGRDIARMHAVAHFVQRIGLDPVILHEKPNAGRTLIEKFEANSDVDYAVVLLTPDDLGASREDVDKIDATKLRALLLPRARQNVYLELGYFLGKLGRRHVCALYVNGVDIPSDYDGVAYVPFDDHDGWHAKLARELREVGLAVDMAKL